MLDIFKYLSANDLITLSIVSRVFNEVISHSKLMKKLQLKFRKLNGDEETMGNRRYTQLKIGFFKSTVHYAILRNIGDDLITLSLINCKIKLDSVRKILNETPNVKSLKFERVSLSDVPNVMKQPHPQLKIMDLTSIVSDPRLFRVIRNCTVQELSLTHDEQDSYDDFSYLVQLLLLQTHLKSLHLTGFYKTSLFSDDTLESVSFKLETFMLSHCIFQKTIHLKAFITAHVESLQHLKISDVALCDLSTILNQMKKLKSLSVSNISMNYLGTLDTVEELNLSGNKVPEIVLEKTAHVKTLRLKYVSRRRLLNWISENLTELESLELVEGSLEELAIPSLRKLTLSNVANCPPLFFELHCKIEELTMIECRFINNEVLEKAAKSLRNLKSLVVIIKENNCGEITNECLKTIGDHCKLIELIRINQPAKKLNWKLLKARKDVKVYI